VSKQFRVQCPDCGGELTIDAATGHVLTHRSVKKAPAKDFDALLAGIGDSKARADEIFQQEWSALKDRDRVLDEKFREAVKRAEESPDEKPKRPWDFD
jgi:hypothetical protein